MAPYVGYVVFYIKSQTQLYSMFDGVQIITEVINDPRLLKVILPCRAAV